ncbi:hypothetical protein AWB82_05855 [Caballeronia glebae]|uniref:Tli3-like domain-containing protein n=1 Tax=Caballeronia glebae TaxID=1777143 RepID=A0A158CUQ4_9BURK|nr:hypothetical protein [Caballeronia glebae]SAK86103.1 hypothetical protein AWB82_05855 [Caballeronia glebae]
MKRVLLTGVLFLMLQACANSGPKPFIYADFERAKVLPYDSPPQVIYRIDDHRFVTLERYRDCNYGDTYFNDTKTSVRTYLGRAGIENFQGKLIISDPTERNIVIPSSAPPQYVCGDRGCSVSLIYSIDGGVTFDWNPFIHSFVPYKDTSEYTVLVTSDSYYIARAEGSGAYVKKFPLVSGYRYGQGEIPGGRHIEYGVKLPSDMHSPSGQERFSCDASIRPTNPDAPLK